MVSTDMECIMLGLLHLYLLQYTLASALFFVSRKKFCLLVTDDLCMVMHLCMVLITPLFVTNKAPASAFIISNASLIWYNYMLVYMMSQSPLLHYAEHTSLQLD